MMKVGIIGAGAVGTATLLAMATRGSAREIVLVNRDRKRAEGMITDLQYGAILAPPVTLGAGDYTELAGAHLVIVTAGVNEKSGGATDRSDPAGRLRLLDKNVAIYRDIVPRIVRAAPSALLLIVTDPPDPLADAARRFAGHERVLSSGTFLDSLRFRLHLARRFGVAAGAVEAQVVGEHGTSSLFLWSGARIGGQPVLDAAGAEADALRRGVEQEVRYANISIIEGTGASQLGIGVVTARIAECILRDEQAVLPIGSYQAAYGVTLSLPTVLGRAGALRCLMPEMTDEERQGLARSAEVLRKAVARIAI
jgi:L-lactate dehydrogenase